MEPGLDILRHIIVWLLTQLTLLLSIICAASGVFLLFWWWMHRRWKASVRKIETGKQHLMCKRCGYNLAGQVIPRCPECGCVIGFKVGFKEMGVAEDEVIRHVEAKHRGAAGPSTLKDVRDTRS